MFALIAWPNGGFAEMVISVHDTEAEAQQAKTEKESSHGAKWRFRISESEA